MLDAFVAAVVRVDEPGREIWRQLPNGKAMILRCDIAALCPVKDTWLVLAAMSILQLVGVATGGQGE